MLLVAAMCQCEEKLLDIAGGENYKERKKLYESIGDMGVSLGNYNLALTYYHLMLEVNIYIFLQVFMYVNINLHNL